MAIPNYTYLKLKMPGPKGVIIVGSSFEHAYEHAGALAEDEALAATLDKMASEALDSMHPSRSDDKALQVSATLDSK